MGIEPDTGPQDAALTAAEAELQVLIAALADLVALAEEEEAAGAHDEAARLRAEVRRRVPGLTVARARVAVLRARRTMRRLGGG